MFSDQEIVRVTYGNPSNGYTDDNVIVTRSCGNLDKYMQVLESGNSFYLMLHQPFYQYNIEWSFSNGSPNQSGAFITYTPPTNFSGIVTATVTVTKADGSYACSGEITFLVELDCDLRGSKKSSDYYTINGDDYRITLKIWVDHNPLTYKRVGSYTKTHKENAFGGWSNYKVDEIRNRLYGDYLNKPNDICEIVTLNGILEYEYNSDDVGTHILENDDKVYFIKDALYTTGQFIENNTVYEYSKNNGRLYLN